MIVYLDQFQMGIEIPFFFSFASDKPLGFQSFHDSETRPYKRIEIVMTDKLLYLEDKDKHKLDFEVGNIIFLLSLERKNFTLENFKTNSYCVGGVIIRVH